MIENLLDPDEFADWLRGEGACEDAMRFVRRNDYDLLACVDALSELDAWTVREWVSFLCDGDGWEHIQGQFQLIKSRRWRLDELWVRPLEDLSVTRRGIGISRRSEKQTWPSYGLLCRWIEERKDRLDRAFIEAVQIFFREVIVPAMKKAQGERCS